VVLDYNLGARGVQNFVRVRYGYLRRQAGL